MTLTLVSPPHGTIKGRRPLAIQPDDCPLLIVWTDSKRATPVTTERFDAEYTIGISWHEATVEEVETLIRDEDISWSLSEARDKIEDRLRTLATTGIGVGAAWQVLPGESTYVGPLPQQGMIHGYAVECIVRVTEE